MSPRRPAVSAAFPSSAASAASASAPRHRARLRAPVLVALLAIAPIAVPCAARGARLLDDAAPTSPSAPPPAQLSGLLRQLNLRARPASREVSRCRSEACRAATAALMA